MSLDASGDQSGHHGSSQPSVGRGCHYLQDSIRHITYFDMEFYV
ncbi:MAG: hypothetical protein QXS17_03445 [Candidatus Micrarchaeaceae archaeon]